MYLYCFKQINNNLFIIILFSSRIGYCRGGQMVFSVSVWRCDSVFGLVCQTNALSDASADSVITESLLATATGSVRHHVTDLSHQHFSSVCAPVHTVNISINQSVKVPK